MEAKGFAVGFLLLLCFSICSSRSCTETRSSYRQDAYTSYYSTSVGYSYSCGWWGWSRCRGTRYRQNSRTSYRSVVTYNTACCSGYSNTCGWNCKACCSPTCKNGGTCDTPGNCICTSGWTGYRCTTDVNECTGSPCHSKALCSNTVGSFTCTCKTGYHGNGRSCSDRNECHSSSSNGCSSAGTCHNTIGSYTCSCNSGYQGNGYTCTDINECSGGHNCHSNAACTNTIGSYSCSCNTGYSGNGFYCNDKNECQLGTDRCHYRATCTNTVGSYSCSCNTGYQGNGFSCRDINECQSSNGGCDQMCTNVIASYYCSCGVGYYLGSDGHSCEDVNECASQNGGCHHNCHNTVGSYYCSCSGAYSLSSDDHTCTVPPPPPTNVQFSMVGTRTARLTWQAPVVTFLNQLTSVSSYRVTARQTSFNISDVVAEVAHTVTVYTFPATLEEFTEYECEVSAGNSFGYGEPSQAVHFKTHETIPSAAPVLDSAEAVSTTLISIHWLPPPSIHINGMLQYYFVNVTEVNTGKKWTFIAVDSSLMIGSLHPYYMYNYSITARTIGNGPYSPVQSVRTLEDAPSGVPQYLTINSKTSSSFTLNWQPPLPSEQNGLIKMYTVLLEEMETGLTFESNSNDTVSTVSSLHPYYHYSCIVRAHTILPGPYSESVVVQLDEDAPSSSPTIITANATSSTSLRLEWTVPENSTHNGVIRSYTVVLEEQETGLLLTYQEAGGTVREVSSLHPYYVYKCQVQAFTVAHGPLSEPVYITTFEDIPSGAPLNVSLAVKTSSSLTFTWEQPHAELWNGIITSYSAFLTELPGSEHTINISTLTTQVMFEVLRPHTSYTFRVGAMNSVGIGPLSASVLSRTAEDAPSESPQNVSLIEIMSDHAVISWAPPPSHLHNGIIREYVIELVQEGQSEGVVYRTGATSFLLADLHPDVSYYVRVAGHTVGLGPYSSQIHLRTLEDIPSSAPVNLGYSNLTSTSLTLLWEPPPPLHRNGPIVNYLINLTEIPTHNSTAFWSNSTSLLLEELSIFTAYSFSVSAATSVGFGPVSEHFLFVTAEDVPASAPENLSGISEDSTSISLSWAPLSPKLLNGVLRYYRINIVEEPTQRYFSVNSSSDWHVLSSLHPFYIYTISVAATTVEVGPFSDSISILTQQDVPSGSPTLSQIAATSRLINLTWAEVAPHQRNGIITGYTMTITNLDDPEGIVMSYDVTSLYLTVRDLRPYTTYGVLLRAHTSVGAGPSSDLYTVQTHEEAPIGRPTNVTTIDIDSTSIHIYWSHPPEDTHYGFLREYRLNVTELETGDKWRVVVEAEATEALLMPLHPYYTYHITIVPVTVEEGDNYTEITLRTAEDAPSTAPNDLSLTELESRSFSLSWDPPLVENTNGIIRKYIINITEQSTGEQLVVIETLNTTIRVHSLHPYTTYLVSVAAYTVGEGPYTPLLEVVTLEEAPTAAPVNLSLHAVTPTTLLISWEPPPLPEQNGEIIEYTYYYSMDGTEGNITEGRTSELEALLEGLQPFRLYFVYVAASTQVGMGPLSAPSLIEMPQDAPSSPPLGVDVVDTFATNFTVVWTPPPSHTHNGIIVGYQLNTTELETGRSFVRETSQLSYTFFHLHPFYTYQFTLSAVTVSPGPVSPVVEVVTLETAPASAPVNITALLVTSTSLTLSWSPPPPQDHNGLLTHYHLQITRLSTQSSLSYHTNVTEMVVEGLVPYSEYEVIVAAFTQEGSGPYSDSFIVHTEQDAPSVPPKNVTIRHVLSQSISLEWIAPEQEELNGELSHYIIHLLEQDSNTVRDLFSTTSEMVLDFLHPFYTYSISVSAVTVLPGPYTREITVRTLEDAPSSPPLNIQAERVSATSFLVTWQPPADEDKNGIIRQYSTAISAKPSWLHSTRQVLFSNDTELTVTSLAPYVTYEIHIRAHTISPGPFSTGYLVTTSEAAPAAAPLNFSLSIVDTTSAELAWQPLPVQHRNGIIRHYLTELYQRNTSESNFLLLREIEGEVFEVLVQDLHPFYEYQARVSAATIEQGPFTAFTSWKMPEDAPSTGPVDIAVSNITSTSFSVTWLPPAYPDQNGVIRTYSLTLTDMTTGNSTVFSVESNVTSFHFDDLHPAYLYSLEIAAATVSQGPNSEPVQVEMDEDIPSGPPADVKEYVLNSTAVQLSWRPLLQEEQNGEILFYTLILARNFSSTVTYQNFTSNSTFAELSSLQPFSEYSISIAASTAVGMGPFTTPQIFHTPEDAPTSSPTILSADLLTPTSFLLKWQLPLLNETNGKIRYFLLNITENETSSTDSVKVYKLSKNIESLHPHYTYSLRIATVTIATGPFSEPFVVQTKEAAPSTPPTNIYIMEVGNRHVNISWSPPLAADQNGVISRYQVNLRLVSQTLAEQWEQSFDTFDTALTILPLLPYRVYSFTMTAYTVDHGPESDPQEFQTLEDAPDGTPLSFEATAITSSEFTLSWAAPLPAKTNGVLREYSLSIVEQKSGFYVLEDVEIEVGSNVTEFAVDYLLPYTVYNCSVSAITVAKGPEAVISVLTSEKAPGQPPEDVTAVIDGPHSINVSWSPPHSEQNGVIRQYLVELSKSDMTIVFYNSSTTSMALTELESHSTYLIRVAAVTIAAGPYSDTVHAFTPETAPYSAPGNCSAIALGSTSIHLSWLPPQDVSINGVLRYYRITVKDPSEAVVYNGIVNADSLETVVSDLHPHTTYHCSVVAVTVAEGPSAEVSIQTLEAAPSGPPQSITSTTHNTSILLTWQPVPPEQQNGVITQYTVTVYTLTTNESQQLVTTDTSIEVLDLHPFYLYELIVAAETTVGVGPYSQPVLQQIPAARPSRAVEDINVTALSHTSVQLSWQPPPRDYWNGVLTSYTITSHSYQPVSTRATNSSQSEAELSNSTLYDTTTHVYTTQDTAWANNADPRFIFTEVVHEHVIVEQLHEFFRYHFTIVMSNSAGDSDPASSPPVQLPGNEPSGPPEQVVVEALSSTSVSVTWEPPAVEHWNGVIDRYLVTLVKQSDGTRLEREFVMEDCWLDCVIEGLEPYSSYSVALAAVSEYGVGPFSEEVPVTTFEDVPSPPLNVTAQPLLENEYLVTWDPPLHKNGLILQYEVDFSPSGQNDSQAYNTRTTTATRLKLSGVIPNHQYSLKVRASTSAGFGNFSKELLIAYKLAESAGVKGETDAGVGWMAGFIIISIVLLVLLFIAALVVLIVFRWKKKYKQVRPVQTTSSASRARSNIWVANPLYQDTDAVEERIRDGGDPVK